MVQTVLRTTLFSLLPPITHTVAQASTHLLLRRSNLRLISTSAALFIDMSLKWVQNEHPVIFLCD